DCLVPPRGAGKGRAREGAADQDPRSHDDSTEGNRRVMRGADRRRASHCERNSRGDVRGCVRGYPERPDPVQCHRRRPVVLHGSGEVAQAGTGTTGPAPGLSGNSGCFVDNGTAVKDVSAASGAGMGTWTTSGWSGTSLALATPTTLKALPSGEVYLVDLVWTLN